MMLIRQSPRKSLGLRNRRNEKKMADESSSRQRDCDEDVNDIDGVSCILCDIHYCDKCSDDIVDNDKDNVHDNRFFGEYRHWINDIFNNNQI